MIVGPITGGDIVVRINVEVVEISERIGGGWIKSETDVEVIIVVAEPEVLVGGIIRHILSLTVSERHLRPVVERTINDDRLKGASANADEQSTGKHNSESKVTASFFHNDYSPDRKS